MLLAACPLRWFFSLFFYDVGHFILQCWAYFFSIDLTNRRVPKLYTPKRTEFFTCHVPRTRTRTAYQRELRIM